MDGGRYMTVRSSFVPTDLDKPNDLMHMGRVHHGNCSTIQSVSLARLNRKKLL